MKLVTFAIPSYNSESFLASCLDSLLVGVDDKILREVIIPTMAISRRCMDGTSQATETLNKSQVFITTAGYKGTFAYERLIGFLVRMIM